MRDTLLDCIARQLFETDEVQEQFFSSVYETFFINCLDSHMDPFDVVEKIKDNIIEDFEESFPDLPTQEINDKYNRLLELCEKYSF